MYDDGTGSNVTMIAILLFPILLPHPCDFYCILLADASPAAQHQWHRPWTGKSNARGLSASPWRSGGGPQRCMILLAYRWPRVRPGWLRGVFDERRLYQLGTGSRNAWQPAIGVGKIIVGMLISY
jgi:hypothetical protein